MRVIEENQIIRAVKEMCIEAAHKLPGDVLCALKAAQAKDVGLAKKILGLTLKNAKIAKEENLPLCQDTGIAVFFIDVGREVFIKGNLERAVNIGVKQGYKEGYLRKSVVSDSLFLRKNTKDNTPAVCHINFCKGDKIKINLLLKGGGAENMSALKFLSPSADAGEVVSFVLETVKNGGAKACPPLVIGVGVGGNFEKCAELAKKALLRKIGSEHKNEKYASLEKNILARVNKLGIGPQGFGGKTTALAVFIEHYPCHFASLPVAVNIGCHSNRHITKIL